jgi:sulfite reductase (NADPH) flavoprotein alpha-component
MFLGLTAVPALETVPFAVAKDSLRFGFIELTDYAWIVLAKELGFFFGDAKRMAADVDKALTEIVAACGKLTADDAVAYVAQLKKAGRYARDIY